MSRETERLAEIPKAYEPKGVEERLYKLWMQKGYFAPKIDPSQRPFVIIMPPPNVTGELHLGHALTATLEDVLVRWHRMKGQPTLWLPGSDHAGIATQVVVEQDLLKEGKTRYQLGREAFIEKVWEWVRKYGRTISEQHKRLGASCDWDRERFTLDEGPSKAVRTTFVNLYRKGLIYRGERIINWCPRCTTALSDLEVEHQQVSSNLYYIRYKLTDRAGYVTVATTRPETLLGDTAVAVHPEDERFKHLVGQKATLPSLGRIIPIIADEAIDPSFGTGALKLTPAHDPVDFDIAQRHNLDAINVLNLDGTMNDNAGPRYKGMASLECRSAILEELESEGLLDKAEPHSHSIGHCQRCKTAVEPIISKQWFVKMKPLASPAIKAVKTGQIKVVPERFTKVYLNWMDNIRDWCISRQLWWGHRIPVWYCNECSAMTVQVDDPSDCEKCQSAEIVQDPDVLDTWFSSALWTHSTLGWPEETEDLRYFYPTSVMETGYDILFFWVARMIMMGMENLGQTPFHTVYLHGLIRDEAGEKMSKVKGNVLNPLDAIETYGTDALRLALTIGTAPGNDSRLSRGKLEASRNFANKLWNASRFVISIMEADKLQSWDSPQPDSLSVEDRWILSRLNRVTGKVNELLEKFLIGEAEQELHDFLWGEYCDWYIEMAKIRLREGTEEVSPVPVLVHVFERVLRLLHPFMPFITEEIWQSLTQRLPNRDGLSESIMIAPYPTPDKRAIDNEAEDFMAKLISLVRSVRDVRADYKIDPSKSVDLVVAGGEYTHFIELKRKSVSNLAKAQIKQVVSEAAQLQQYKNAVPIVLEGLEAMVLLESLIDVESEKRRFQEEIEGAKQQITRLTDMFANEDFITKAPAHVVERERRKLEDLKEKEEKLRERLAQLR